MQHATLSLRFSSFRRRLFHRPFLFEAGGSYASPGQEAARADIESARQSLQSRLFLFRVSGRCRRRRCHIERVDGESRYFASKKDAPPRLATRKHAAVFLPCSPPGVRARRALSHDFCSVSRSSTSSAICQSRFRGFSPINSWHKPRSFCGRNSASSKQASMGPKKLIFFVMRKCFCCCQKDDSLLAGRDAIAR